MIIFNCDDNASFQADCATKTSQRKMNFYTWDSFHKYFTRHKFFLDFLKSKIHEHRLCSVWTFIAWWNWSLLRASHANNFMMLSNLLTKGIVKRVDDILARAIREEKFRWHLWSSRQSSSKKCVLCSISGSINKIKNNSLSLYRK